MTADYRAVQDDDAVPAFVRPFEGSPDVGGFFDHGSTDDKRQLTRSGTVAYGRRGHHGYDFGLRVGTPVFAMAPGRVVVAGDEGPVRCGDRRVESSVLVRIAHDPAPNGARYTTVLMHLSDVTVAKGDVVTAGQLVGHSGNTGCSSGPHLHVTVFEGDGLFDRGASIDPYGWTGPGADPHPERSVWLWKPGEAPPLRRHSRRPKSARDAFGPARVRGTDLLDPVDGEWLDLRNPTDAPRPVGGLVLVNDRGDRLVLPDRSVPPDRILRIWTRNPSPGKAGISWGLDHEAWNDAGDCARLLDASGALVGTLRFGPKTVSCPVVGPAPTEAEEPDETEATESEEQRPLAIPVGPTGAP